MSKQVKIKKLCLEIGSKKIELTLKQAQELKDVLNDTFGEEVTEYIYRDRWTYPQHYPYFTYTGTICQANEQIDLTANSGTFAPDQAVTSGYAQVVEWAGSTSNDTLTLTTQ